MSLDGGGFTATTVADAVALGTGGTEVTIGATEVAIVGAEVTSGATAVALG